MLASSGKPEMISGWLPGRRLCRGRCRRDTCYGGTEGPMSCLQLTTGSPNKYNERHESAHPALSRVHVTYVPGNYVSTPTPLG